MKLMLSRVKILSLTKDKILQILFLHLTLTPMRDLEQRVRLQVTVWR